MAVYGIRVPLRKPAVFVLAAVLPVRVADSSKAACPAPVADMRAAVPHTVRVVRTVAAGTSAFGRLVAAVRKLAAVFRLTVRGAVPEPVECASPLHAEQRELKSLTVIGAGKPATYPLCCLESVCSGWDCGLPKHIPVSACRIIPCVASVAVSPYNLSKNQNRLSGRLFPCVFSATCRKENTHGKRSRNARDNTVLIYL